MHLPGHLYKFTVYVPSVREQRNVHGDLDRERGSTIRERERERERDGGGNAVTEHCEHTDPDTHPKTPCFTQQAHMGTHGLVEVIKMELFQDRKSVV